MNVALFNNADIQGGASIAADRLFRGLLKRGVNAHYFVRNRRGDHSRSHAIHPISDEQQIIQRSSSQAVDALFNALPNEAGQTLFSWALTGYSLGKAPFLAEADLFHLHWVTDFITHAGVGELLATGKPVIWTMHDEAAYTGGCHYTDGCEQFTNDCTHCPQINALHDLPPLVLASKRQLFAESKNLTIVTPSQWLADRVKANSLFSDLEVLCIPNGIDTSLYHPSRRTKARQLAGIEDGEIVLFCGAQNLNEKRKGFHLLLEALQQLNANDKLPPNVSLLTIGVQADQQLIDGVRHRHIDSTSDQEELANTFACADLFILPSLQDNLPNTALEALSSGVPVIAFNRGGIPEIVTDREQGMIAKSVSPESLAQAIHEAISNAAWRKEASAQARLKAETAYSIESCAQKHEELYASKTQEGQQSAQQWKIPDRIEAPLEFCAGPDGLTAALYANAMKLKQHEALIQQYEQRLEEADHHLQHQKSKVAKIEASRTWKVAGPIYLWEKNRKRGQ